MRKTRARVGSILLTLALVLSLLPVTALAGDINSAEALQSALTAAAETGGTVTLGDSITVSSGAATTSGAIEISNAAGDVVLDGNGKTITAENFSAATHIINVASCTGTVTIKNLTIVGNTTTGNGLNIYNSPNVVLENVTIQNAAGGGLVVNASGVKVLGDLTLTGNGWKNGINVGWGVGVPAPEGTVCTFDASRATAVNCAAIYTGIDDIENAGTADKFEVLLPGGAKTVEVELRNEVNLLTAIIYSPAVAEMNGIYYATLKSAITAAQNGDTVKLLANVDLTDKITITSDLTINLDDFTITDKVSGDGFCASSGTLVLQGGTIVSNNSGGQGLYIYGTANVTLKDMTVTGNSRYGMIYLDGNAALTVDRDSKIAAVGATEQVSPAKQAISVWDNAKLYVYGTVSAIDHYAIAGNGTSSPGTEIVIFDGAEILSSGTTNSAAIYHPNSGTLTVRGGTISGKTGIEMRAGTLTVEGNSIITGTAEEIEVQPNGNGNTTAGAGIAIAQHTTDLPITVNISGGTISGCAAVYESNPQENADVAEDVSIHITGGNFRTINGGTDSVYSEDCTGFITGGYFTSDPSAYLAEGLAAVASDKAGYAYMVGEAGDTPAAVVPGEADVSVSGTITGTEEKSLAESVSTALQGTAPSIGQDLNSAAASVANQNSVTADTTVDGGKTVQEALEALDGTPPTIENPEEAITIVVQPYLDIRVTDVSIEGESGSETKTVTLDITPMYITVATTANVDGDTPDTIVIAGDGVSNANAIQVGNPKELTITKPVEVTLSLPENFVSGGEGTLYIKHEKTPGTVYYYTGTVDNNVLTFTNPHGFSAFTLMSTNEAKAEIGNVGYPTLQAAVNAVTSGGTIKVLENGQSAVVSREVTFTLTGTGTAQITAGSGYQLTQNGNTYTVTRLPETSDGSSGGSSGGSGSSGGDYSVSVPSGSSIRGGSITVSPRSADKGDTVTITVKPDDGYVLDKLTVSTRAGAAVDLTRKSSTQYTFTMPAGSVVIDVSFVREGTSAEMAFTDVAESFWAYSEIQWAYDNGYMNGTSAVSFNPNGTVNRQQVWMILARMAGASPANMAEAKAWAVENGISDGTNPTGAVTRQQLVALLYRFASKNGYNVSNKADLSIYPDAASVASYATDAMAWAVANGIIGGTTQGTLNAAGNSNRAQLAVILWRFYQTTAG